MKEESGKIYCLVRNGNRDDRRGKLYETLQYYFGNRYENEFGKRIMPVIGDIERDGLSEQMPMDIQTVIHTAASVKHYGSYEYFYRVNVGGTQHVIDYARSVGAKLIHISTLSVSGNSMADDFSVYRSEKEKYFYETSFYIGQPLDNVYIHSKIHELGIPMKVVEGTAFYDALQETMKNRGTEYIFEAFQNDMDEQGKLIYDSNIHIVNDFTMWFLKQVGFEWNETDMPYISGYIEYFRNIGYLKV